MDWNKDNLSTIFVFVYMLIAPILVKYGYEIKQEVFVSAMVAIVGLIGAIYSAKNPNRLKIFGNDIRPPYDIENPVLNDEYTTEDENDGGC